MPVRPACNLRAVILSLAMFLATACSIFAQNPSSPLKKGTVPLGSVDLLRKNHSLERDSPLFQQPAKPRQERTAEKTDVVTEEIHFLHGKNDLAGTFYIPPSPGPHPAVVMILGSGAQDRNYAGAGPVLSGHFARHGF